MIVEYLRPQKLEDAIQLLARSDILTVPLGGGTKLSQGMKQTCAVVDLQSVGLNTVGIDDQFIKIGATVRLNNLLSINEIQPSIKKIVDKEKTYNLRQMSTVAGTMVSCDGKSSLAAAFLAMDAQMIWQPGPKEISLEDWLSQRRDWHQALLITGLLIPRKVDFQFEIISNSPDSQSIISAFCARWENGRVRIVAGGYGEAPVVVFDDKLDKDSILSSVRCYQYPGDNWASAEFRQDVMEKMTRRLL